MYLRCASKSSSPINKPPVVTPTAVAQGDLVAAKGQAGSAAPVQVQVGAAPAGAGAPGFDAGAYFGALRTRALGGVLLAARELPSTQTLLQDNAVLIVDGAVAVADRQVAGKGARLLPWTMERSCIC